MIDPRVVLLSLAATLAASVVLIVRTSSRRGRRVVARRIERRTSTVPIRELLGQ